MRRLGRAALALSLVVLTVLLGLDPSAAQDESPALVIRSVDATDPANVEVVFGYQGDRNDLADLAVRESGDLVEATTAVPLSDQQALGVVLTIDVSGSMEEGALIERVLEAAREFVSNKSVADQVAIVTFSDEVRLVQDFTTDEDTLLDALDSQNVGGETDLYDGVVRAAALFEDSELQPNIIVFSDGADVGSVATADRAEAAVRNVGGALFALGVDNPGFGVLRDIAERTGGTSAVASDPAGVDALFAGVQETLQKQYVTTYPSRVDAGAVPVVLTVGTAQAEVEVVVGSAQTGTANLEPAPIASPSGPKLLREKTGLYIGLGLLALAAFVAALSLGITFLGRENTLSQTLSPYSEGYVASGEFDEDDGGDGRPQQMATSAVLQRAVAATGSFAERQGLLQKVEAKLEQANLALRPAEAIFFYAIGIVIVAALFLALAGNAFGALIGTFLAALVPPAVLNFLASRRKKQFNALLPDTLQLLASTLRAGFSLMQGVEAVSTEVSEPIGRELRRVVTEARLGRPLEEALEGVANRMDSDDFGWAVMAIRIQREVGGNLAELLVTVADTMVERERLRRDVNALTAEGRVSAIVLGLLPVGIGVFIMGANPGYMDPLFDETMGRILLIGAGVLMAVGFYWMKKTIEVEI
ncbi:MAG: type II secretion system F family protein [Acidimicrobiia bacterium]|jgi:tight adherence protein B